MTYKYLTSCPVCTSLDFKYLKGFEILYLCKCSMCSFVFDKRIPTQDELYEHYKVYAYSALKPISKQTVKSYNKLLDEFEKYRTSGNILDIGCGQGDFLIEAHKRNWTVYGSEYSQAAVTLCKSRGINMYQGDLDNNIFADVCFDVITSFEMIEHINNPEKLMEVVDSKLRGKGLFYCTTPNFNALLRYLEKVKFKMIVYPEHISFYTKKSLLFLGDKYKFRASKVLTTGIDIGRFIAVVKHKKESKTSTDIQQNKAINENIRDLAGSNKFMMIIKGIINFMLTSFGKGDTLKIYFVKQIDKG